MMQEWELPPDKAYPWRAVQAAMLGSGYGLRLQWDKSVIVTGNQVAFLVKYRRSDGKTITSTRQVLRVPGHGAAVASAE